VRRLQRMVIYAVHHSPSTSLSPGARNMTSSLPALRCAPALPLLVKNPVHSSHDVHGEFLPTAVSAGFLCAHTLIFVAVDDKEIAFDRKQAPGNLPCACVVLGEDAH